ncbi:MAG: type II RES/Xre toxin-antitoxin system antitoxin [Gemmatimonadota bacterium]
MTAHAVAQKLGGKRTLRRVIRSDLDLARAIHGGLPVGAVDRVLEAGLLEPAELYELVIPRRTLTHRRKQRTLTPEQSDRLARVVRVLLRAEEALDDPEKAARWMRSANRALAGSRPIDLLESDIGARTVEKVLGRLEHGVYS